MGIIIALSGADGAGKTTWGSYIKKYLKESNYSRVKYIKTFDHFLIKYTKSSKYVEERRSEYLDKSFNEQPISNKLFFRIWPYIVFIDNLLFVIYAKYVSKDVFIFDRFIHDHYVAFNLKGYVGRIFKLLIKIIPKPLVHLYIICDPEVAYERTKDTHNLPLDYFTECRAIYETVNREKNIVNTNLNTEKNRKKILSILEKKIV